MPLCTKQIWRNRGSAWAPCINPVQGGRAAASGLGRHESAIDDRTIEAVRRTVQLFIRYQYRPGAISSYDGSPARFFHTDLSGTK
jgi:hypothetical protein